MRVMGHRDAILGACAALFAAGQVVEVRALDAVTRAVGRRHTVAGYFDDWARLASAAATVTARGVYVTLNPLDRALLSRAANRLIDVGPGDALTADADVIGRRWLPIDLDPRRPAGVSASDAEHTLALERAAQVADWLSEQGWPEPLRADSGNGAHLLYRVDLPADTPLIAAALAGLAERFDDDAVKVDRKVFNPARIWKLYGTIAAKGDDTRERPHRLSRILAAPEGWGVVSAEMLAGVGVETKPDRSSRPVRFEDATTKPDRSSRPVRFGNPRDFDLGKWIAASGLDVTEPREWQGGQRWVLRVCPWNPQHTNGSAFIAQLPGGAISAGCHHDSCAGKGWRELRAVVECGASLRANSVGATCKPGPASQETCGTNETCGTYLIDGGRMWKREFGRREGELVEVGRKVIADFAVRIVEEARAEDGGVWFTLAGETAAGGAMRLTLPVADFIAEKPLLAALTAAAGASCGAHMVTSLRPAIQALSTGARVTRLFNRTGWAEIDGARRFLLPGRAVEDAQVRLRKLPYECATALQVSPTELARRLAAQETDAAQEGFRSLLYALDPRRTTVIATLVFEAPFAGLAGWAGERYAVFIAGRTGSLKTSFAQALMCVWGAGFLADQNLLKFGEGATRNALLSYAEQARDLPLLVDNYKPNTGDGARGLVNLLHNLIEGAGRERLNRYAELQEARPIGCWPLLTGEDAPRGDAAALARLLVTPVRWSDEGNNAELSAAQAAAGAFPRLGAAWLDWLESDAGRAAGRRAAGAFEATRAKWAGQVTGGANPLRLATNLATNELTWRALGEHPLFAELAREFAEAHAAGLALLASEMAQQTAENVEAARFVDVLRQLLASGACRLAERGEGRPGDEVIGWHAPDGGAYLLPDLARRAVESALGGDGLNRVSNEALYGQLEELGLIGSHDDGRRTKMVRVRPGQAIRALHLAAAALGECDE